MIVGVMIDHLPVNKIENRLLYSYVPYYLYYYFTFMFHITYNTINKACLYSSASYPLFMYSYVSLV